MKKINNTKASFKWNETIQELFRLQEKADRKRKLYAKKEYKIGEKNQENQEK